MNTTIVVACLVGVFAFLTRRAVELVTIWIRATLGQRQVEWALIRATCHIEAIQPDLTGKDKAQAIQRQFRIFMLSTNSIFESTPRTAIMPKAGSEQDQATSPIKSRKPFTSSGADRRSK